MTLGVRVQEMGKNAPLYKTGKEAVLLLAQSRRCGSYHVIRDPDGVVTLWSVTREKP